MTDDQVREKARDLHGSTEVEVDADAELSVGDDGTWVQAWVFVPKHEMEDTDGR